MKSEEDQQFAYTSEGLKKARQWAKKHGKLDELDSSGNGFSTDGYSQVQQCNFWYNKINNNKE